MEVNEIYQGDCLELMRQLPDGFVDLIVTDPPYNMDYHGRGERNQFDPLANDQLTSDEHSAWFTACLDQMHRVLADNSHIYIWIDWRNYGRVYELVARRFTIKNCIVWDKSSIGMGQRYRFQHEFCIFAEKGDGKELKLEKRNVSDIWRCKRDATSDYQHPTQKPVDLIYPAITNSSEPDGLVLDPFSGSGTTCVAAKQAGRRYLGFELDPKYVDVARGRLRQGMLF